MRSIIKSVFRIILITLFIKSLVNLVNYSVVTWYNRSNVPGWQELWNELGILSIGFLISLLILWILWWKTDSLVKILAGNINDNKLEISTSNIELFKVALIFLGIYLVISVIPDMAGSIGYRYYLKSIDPGPVGSPQTRAYEMKQWIIPVVSILIGLVLVFWVKKHWWKQNNVKREKKGMLYPSRPFSITGISIEGFDSAKAYPVLAINMDQSVVDIQKPEETEASEPPSSQNIAFFLVGGDNGEFAWIAEDECKLAPLKD